MSLPHLPPGVHAGPPRSVTPTKTTAAGSARGLTAASAATLAPAGTQHSPPPPPPQGPIPERVHKPAPPPPNPPIEPVASAFKAAGVAGVASLAGGSLTGDGAVEHDERSASERSAAVRAATLVQARVRGIKARTRTSLKRARTAVARTSRAGETSSVTPVRALKKQVSCALNRTAILGKGVAVETAGLAVGTVKGTVFGAGEFARFLWRHPALAANDFMLLLQKSPDMAAGLLKSLANANGGFEAIVQLGSALRDSADGTRRKQYVAMLRRSVWLTLSLCKAALRRESVLAALRGKVNAFLASLHLSSGMRIDEEGLLANYKLELLRLNDSQSQALRAVGVYPTIGGRTSKKPLYHYEVVRKTQPLEQNLHSPSGRQLLPTDVREFGFLHQFLINVSRASAPKAKASAGAAPSPAAASGAEYGVAPAAAPAAALAPSAAAAGLDEREPVDQVDDYIDERYPSCLAAPLKRCLPPWWKAQLPFEVSDTWLPASLRDHADEIVALELDLEMNLIFDPENEVAEVAPCDLEDALSRLTPSPALVKRRTGLGLGNGGGNRGSPATSAAPSAVAATAGSAYHGGRSQEDLPTPVRFQFQLTGEGCWPTLAQLTVRSVRFRASCKVWWDVFQQRLLIAFLDVRKPGARGTDGVETEDGVVSAEGAAAHGASSEGVRFDTDVDLSFLGAVCRYQPTSRPGCCQTW